MVTGNIMTFQQIDRNVVCVILPDGRYGYFIVGDLGIHIVRPYKTIFGSRVGDRDDWCDFVITFDFAGFLAAQQAVLN